MEHRTQAGGRRADAEAYRPVLEALPVPVLLVEAHGAHGVLLVNDAFTERLGSSSADGAGEAAALRAVVPADVRVLVAGDGPGRDLDEVLDDLLAVPDPAPWESRLRHETGEGPAVEWRLSLCPVRHADGVVFGVLLVFGEGALATGPGALPAHTEALHDLAVGLSADKPAARIHADIARAAAAAVGAGRAAVLLDEGGGAFSVAATTPGAGLPGRDVLLEASAGVWQVAFGRTRTHWDGAGDPPLPFAGRPGWERLLIVGIRMRGRQSALLVVGEPHHGTFDEGALERLSLVAELASTALDNARLVDSFARLERLLRGAVDASAAIVESTEPAVVRRRLLGALVDHVGMAGAALWQERDDGAGMTLVASAGLPGDVRERVSSLPVTSIAARMASGQLGARLRHTVTSAATSSWDGHVVRLVPVPEPARAVLGVYADRPLPALVDDVLSTLAHALASAVHQTTLHQRARTVIDSLQRELRPRSLVLPEGLSVGTVYRSATAGVDVGGDFYDVFHTRSGHIGIACGDVSGKGVEAASLTAMAVYSLRAFGLPGISPPDVLALLNGAVVEQTSAERFMTLAYLRLDTEAWTLQLAVAGHPPPVLVDHRGPRLLDVVPGVPIGVLEDEEYAPVDLDLDEGAALVLYTDGVTEARREGAPGSELLGTEGLLRAVAALPAADAQGLADGVWAAVLDWTGGGTSDDCAVVVVRRAGSAEGRLDVALARTA